jgi:hypothetical protein
MPGVAVKALFGHSQFNRSNGLMSVRLAATVLTLSLAAPSPATAGTDDPLRFFEGRTESTSLVKIVTKKPFHSRAVGQGQIAPDGTLTLIQRVEDQGQLPKERRWKMRKTGPGTYSGTMSEARGPVAVNEVDGKFRFRFRMEGSVAVEQWLIPAADGKSAASKVTIRKYGLVVGHSDGVIKKLD